jgi:hypothetical protein
VAVSDAERPEAAQAVPEEEVGVKGAAPVLAEGRGPFTSTQSSAASSTGTSSPH